jgi:hypothetical protein
MRKDWMIEHSIANFLMTMCFCILALSSGLAQGIEATPLLPAVIDHGFTSEGGANGLRQIVDTKNAVTYPAIYATYQSDSFTEKTHTSGFAENVIAEIAPDPHAIVDKLPTTITVRTEVLLELHSMWNNAVNLCLKIPTKYRTRLPECADIFSHEIRLQALARNKK